MWRGADRGGVYHLTLADQQQQQQRHQQSLQQPQQPQQQSLQQPQQQQQSLQQPQPQQHHQQQWGPSPRAMHALDLYRACVAAGQKARFVVEQRPEEEYFSLTSWPPSPAAAASVTRLSTGPRK